MILLYVSGWQSPMLGHIIFATAPLNCGVVITVFISRDVPQAKLTQFSRHFTAEFDY